ncbi:MAG: LacI family DNA-binding transcriptional regulator [Actinomycetaceae bacterium]|nr:LacI family DNA-binding transcriptional regulator [Actinomycetaceae bacterium]
MATIREVADRAGVSLATVSRALNHPDQVSEDTLQQVQSAVRELKYIPSANARSLRKSKAELIGVVVPSLSNPFFPALLEQASIEAEKQSYSVLIKVDANPLRSAQILERSDAVDGIVVVDNQWTFQEERRRVEFRVPVIAFDRVPSFDVLSTYQVDNTQGAYVVTSHLLKLGARKLLHIAGPEGLDVSVKRRMGFEQAIENHRTATVESKIIPGDFTLDAGTQCLDNALEDGFVPDAVFAANDLMGIGAMRAATYRGLAVPSDIKIGGFDDLFISDFAKPGLTTYRQPIETIAQEAVRKLLTLVSKDKIQHDEAMNSVHTFEGQLIVRGSTVK